MVNKPQSWKPLIDKRREENFIGRKDETSSL